MTPALPTGCVIALLGADDGGKTRLAEALSQRLAQRGIAATLLADALPQPLDAAALEAHRGYTLTLLVAPSAPTPVDDMLRRALMDAKLAFAVVHGEGAEQLGNAWNAINAVADPDARSSAAPGASATWSWSCEKCSDPACEHRLFSDLVAKR